MLPSPPETETHAPAEAIRFGRFCLAPRARRLTADGDPVAISSRALDILIVLVEARGRIVSRDELIARAWPNLTVDPANISVQVSALRRALADPADMPGLVATVPGRGYQFVGRIDPVAAATDPPAAEHPPCPPARPPARRRRARLATPGLAVMGLVLVLALGLASQFRAARAIVIEPFETPAALVPSGITGSMLASAVMDALTKLEADTQATAASHTLASRPTVIEVDRPVSLPYRLLRAATRRDIHVGGSLRETDGAGVALDIRGEGVLPRSITGKLSDLPRVITEAAEHIYGQLQPAPYAVYLDQAGRFADELRFARTAYYTASAADRPHLLNDWGNALTATGGSQREALSLYEEAIRQQPEYWTAYNNAMNAHWALGDEEGAWAIGERMRAAAGGRPGRADELQYANYDTLTWNLLPWRDAVAAEAAKYGGFGREPVEAVIVLADIDWRLHDAAAARQHIAMARGAGGDAIVAGLAHFVLGNLAYAEGDHAAAARELEAFGAAYANPVLASNFPGYACWVAPAEEQAGRPDRADEVLRRGGRFVDCARFRADTLDARGRWDEARRAYAAAVALAPDLPAAYYSWGLALARHGDLAGAAAQYAAARARAPHWADPLKAWGDALIAEGDHRGAARKYAEALRDAPEWPALRAAANLAGPP